MPKITVIIPNYNHAKYLKQRIESVLNQTYQEFEVILLDDNSTDNSVSILKSYIDHPKVSSLIINENNSGNTFVQWEKGISAAKGDYIWLAESDDYACITFLERCINIFEKDNDIGLVFTNSQKVSSKDINLGLWHHNEPWGSSWKIPYKEARYYFLRQNFIPNASSVVFKKSLINTTSFAKKEYKLVGDWELWYKCVLQADIYYIHDALNYFRCHEENVRTKMKKTNNGFFEIIKLKTQIFFSEKPTLQEEKQFLYTIVDYWLSSTFFGERKITLKKHLVIFNTLKKMGFMNVINAAARTYLTLIFRNLKK